MKQTTKGRGASVAQGAGAVSQVSVQRPAAAPAPISANGMTPNPAPRVTAPRESTPTREEIARRAYEIYLARAGRAGSPEDDWSQAERELSSRSLAGRGDAI